MRNKTKLLIQLHLCIGRIAGNELECFEKMLKKSCVTVYYEDRKMLRQQKVLHKRIIVVF